jgi:hypothetical protein
MDLRGSRKDGRSIPAECLSWHKTPRSQYQSPDPVEKSKSTTAVSWTSGKGTRRRSVVSDIPDKTPPLRSRKVYQRSRMNSDEQGYNRGSMDVQEDWDTATRTPSAVLSWERLRHGDRGRLTSAHSNGHPKRIEEHVQ